MNDDLVKTLDKLSTGTAISTQKNKVLQAPMPVAAIPSRTGSFTQTRGASS